MFLAHGFCYQLQVGSESGDGPSDELVQAAMDGFAFTKAPPALPSEPAVPTESATRKAYRFSYWMGRVAAICFILILVALVLNKTVFRKKREEDTSERDKAA